MQQHPTAIISPEAQIDANVTIGPYVVIEGDAVIGEGSHLHAHAVIHTGSRLGKGVEVGCHCAIGGLPQSVTFDPSVQSRVAIGDGTVLRESVTVNRATQAEQQTRVGRNCFLMACAHVGHDCQVGDAVVLANNVMLAGFVTIGDNAFLGGACAIHQYVRLGEGVMLSGVSRLTKDLPPFLMAAERDEVIGLNLVGLRRRGIPREAIREIKELYRLVYGARGRLPDIARDISNTAPPETDEGKRFLDFISSADGKRGFLRPRRDAQPVDDMA